MGPMRLSSIRKRIRLRWLGRWFDLEKAHETFYGVGWLYTVASGSDLLGVGVKALGLEADWIGFPERIRAWGTCPSVPTSTRK